MLYWFKPNDLILRFKQCRNNRQFKVTISSNTCFNYSERRTSDSNVCGLRVNTHWGNILLLDFFSSCKTSDSNIVIIAKYVCLWKTRVSVLTVVLILENGLQAYTYAKAWTMMLVLDTALNYFWIHDQWAWSNNIMKVNSSMSVSLAHFLNLNQKQWVHKSLFVNSVQYEHETWSRSS